MRRTILIASTLLVMLGAAAPAARALGPVDGEVGAFYWSADTENEGETANTDGTGLRAEVWFFKKLGVSAEYFDVDGSYPGSTSDFTIKYRDLDVKWRPFSPTENTFFAIGAGWEDMDIDGLDTSGVRLLAEGRVGFLGRAYAYGRVAYLPSLDDIQDGGFVLATDVDGREYDLGVGVEPAPFFSVWAGYRSTKINYTAEGFDADLKTDGFYAGLGVHF